MYSLYSSTQTANMYHVIPRIAEGSGFLFNDTSFQEQIIRGTLF